MNDYGTTLADLESKLGRIDDERTELMAAISAVRKLMGMMQGPPIRGLAPVDAAYKKKMTVFDAAKTVLNAHGGGPMSAGDIARQLKSGGFPNTAKSLSNTVYSILHAKSKAGAGVTKNGTEFELTRKRASA